MCLAGMIRSERMLGAAVAEEAEDPARRAGQLEGKAALFLSTEHSNLP